MDDLFQRAGYMQNVAAEFGKLAVHLRCSDSKIVADNAALILHKSELASVNYAMARDALWAHLEEQRHPSQLDWDEEYVVYAADLNSLYDAVPRSPVVVATTRLRSMAEFTVERFQTHDMAAWFTREAVKYDRDKSLRLVDPSTLHVGDHVLIHLGHRAFGDDDSTFDAVLTAVEPRTSTYTIYGESAAPLISWEPEYPRDYLKMGTDDTMEPYAHCDAGFVVAVLKRAPFRTRANHVNVYAARDTRLGERLYRTEDHVWHRANGCVAAHPFQLAQSVMGNHPHLRVEHFDSDRFWAEWERVGKPGLRGYAYWSYTDASNTWHFAPVRPDHDDVWRSHHWINLKTFKRWLLRAYPRLYITKATARAHAIADAKEDERRYAEDMAYLDGRERERGSRTVTEGDTRDVNFNADDAGDLEDMDDDDDYDAYDWFAENDYNHDMHIDNEPRVLDEDGALDEEATDHARMLREDEENRAPNWMPGSYEQMNGRLERDGIRYTDSGPTLGDILSAALAKGK